MSEIRNKLYNCNLDLDSLKFIESGSERYVFKYNNDKVVKISEYSDDDINQNTREFDFYQRIKNKDVKNKFAKIYSGNGSYIIQEYIDDIGDVSNEEIKEWVEKVENSGIKVHDKEPENFGYKNNKVVMVDYAGCFLK